MAKYDPLRELLRSNGASSVTLTFEEIERAIGGSLPASSREHPAWWANEDGSGHVQSNAWMDAGYRVERVDQIARHVRFVKG